MPDNIDAIVREVLKAKQRVAECYSRWQKSLETGTDPYAAKRLDESRVDYRNIAGRHMPAILAELERRGEELAAARARSQIKDRQMASLVRKKVSQEWNAKHRNRWKECLALLRDSRNILGTVADLQAPYEIHSDYCPRKSREVLDAVIPYLAAYGDKE